MAGFFVHDLTPPWGIAKFAFVAFALAVCAGLALLDLRKPAVRRDWADALSRNKTLVALACLFLAAAWASAIKVGFPFRLGSQPFRYFLFSTGVIAFIHLLLPAFAVREEDEAFLLRWVAYLGILILGLTWALAAAYWIGGLDWGIFPLEELILEKRAFLESIGATYALRGIFPHPNYIGMFVVIFAPSLYYLFRTAPTRRMKWVAGAGIVLTGPSLLLSFSVLQVIPFLTIVLGLFASRRMGFHRLILVGLFLILAFFSLFVFVHGRLDFLDWPLITQDTRVQMWDRALEAVHHGGFWGTDPETAFRDMPYEMDLHNTYIETAYVSGIPSLVVFVVYLAVFAVALFPRPGDVLGLCLFYTIVGLIMLQCFESIPFGGKYRFASYLPLLGMAWLFSRPGGREHPG